MSRKKQPAKAADTQEAIGLQPEGGRHVLYVYGSLRTGTAKKVFHIPGALFDMGDYPAARLFNPVVQEYIVCERIIVDDHRLSELDAYECYKPHSPETSLFIRKPIYDGEIYSYNRDLLTAHKIKGGDWLVYCNLIKKTTMLNPERLKGSNVLGPPDDPALDKPPKLLPPPSLIDVVEDFTPQVLPVLDDYRSGAR